MNNIIEVIFAFIEWAWEHLVELIILGLVSGLIYFVFWIQKMENEVWMPEAYAAWVKQTENPKQLTYREWRMLVHSHENEHRR